jgi:hypothetical protein
MAQVTLDQVIELVSSDKPKERTDGLGGLKIVTQRYHPRTNFLRLKAYSPTK